MNALFPNAMCICNIGGLNHKIASLKTTTGFAKLNEFFREPNIYLARHMKQSNCFMFPP